MPRTRTIPDEQILNATVELVSRYGVDKLTFASLSKHIGLSPATLVQRFGTKEQLLITVTGHCLQNMVPAINLAEHKHSSALQAIYTAYETMAKAVTGVKEFANGQIFFYLALTDPETNVILQKSMAESRDKIRQLLNEAVEQKELKPCDTTKLALTVQTTYEGAITTWLVYQDGPIGPWVTRQLTEVIGPYTNNK